MQVHIGGTHTAAERAAQGRACCIDDVERRRTGGRKRTAGKAAASGGKLPARRSGARVGADSGFRQQP